MRRHGKRFKANRVLLDNVTKADFKEALAVLRAVKLAKFDETVEVAVRLGIDPKNTDQLVRGAVVMPHGTGKKVRVLVFAKGDKEKEALEAGADFVGADDLVEKIKNGWLDFDKTIATPDMMKDVGKIGRVLGTRGLMPNPKLGTVTNDIAKAVRETKAGRVEFRAEKAGIVHAVLGKASFNDQQLTENFIAFLDQINKLKPKTSKGVYIKGMTLTTTMGPGIALDPAKVMALLG